MSESVESVGSELSFPEEEGEEVDPIGKYIGGRNARGERHGRGWAILPNGDQYDGYYRNGRRHGLGVYVFKTGERYYGNYRCGHRSGRGIFIYPDGSLYEGNWRMGIKHGKGRYSYANGDCYAGDWHRGLRHGVGIYTYAQRDKDVKCTVRFKGTWVKDKRYGPFEAYLLTNDRCTIVHGFWCAMYPYGSTVFSFNEQYMLNGFFKLPFETEITKRDLGEDGLYLEEAGEEGKENEDPGIFEPTDWYVQDIGVYDYSQLPQEPVPIPMSDSEFSVCTPTPSPTVASTIESFGFMDEGEEGEGEGECEICDFECSMSDIETDSEPCAVEERPCAIEGTTEKPDCKN